MDCIMLDPDVAGCSDKGPVFCQLSSPSNSSTKSNGDQLTEISDSKLGADVSNDSMPYDRGADGSTQLANGSVSKTSRGRSAASFVAWSGSPETRILIDKLGLEALLYRLVVASYFDQPVGVQNSSSASCLNLSEITIIDKLFISNYVEHSGEYQTDITFFVKPCKFFMYCFLAAFRHHSSLVSPIGSWRSQLYSAQLNFNFSSPDSAAVDRCIFGKEKVFSSKSGRGKSKRKLAFSDKVRRSPRLSATRC